MKKIGNFCLFYRWKLQKECKIMRLMVILILGFSLQAYSGALAQNGNISLERKNLSVEEVILCLKKQTSYKFMYNHEELQALGSKDVRFKNASIREVLEVLLAGSSLYYTIEDDVVIISKRKGIAPEEKEKKSIRITGLVVDEKKQPLPGVTIVLKGSSIGTVTDSVGNFELNLMEGNDMILVFSFIGMETQEVKYVGQKKIDVVMREDTEEVEEVVVTGIFKRTKSSYTGSVTTVTAEELKQFGNRNLLTSLGNIDPSFNIIESNVDGSNPNRKYEVQIRGNSNVPNVDELKDETRVDMNAPLVILDGFESSIERMLDMNENEVESITLLKDASATSIYGSRGANGVIVITTKVPTMGKLRLTYRGDLNLEVPDLSSYDLLNAREKLDLEMKVGLWNANNVTMMRNYYSLLNDVNAGVDTYWLSKPLRVGVGQRHNLRIDGGDATFRYSASIQYNDVQGVMKDSWRKTGNGTLTLSYYYKNLKFTNNLIVGLNKSSESPYGSFADYVKMNPYYRVHDDNGNLIKEYKKIHDGKYLRTIGNPLYNAELNVFDTEEYTQLTNNFSIEWRVIPDLLLRGKIGINKTFNEGDKFKPAEHTDFSDYKEEDLFRKGTYDYYTGKSFNYDASINLSYTKTLKDVHTVYVGLDYNMRQTESNRYSIKAEGFSNQDFDFFGMGLQYADGSKPSGTESKSRSVGFTGSLNYTYDNRYYIDLSGRVDGSSQFGSEKRFAPFWSVGLGWNIHREKFLKDNAVISFLKLRGSTGITGSQNFSSYQALSTYKYVIDKRYYNWMGALMMGLGNEDLSWQQKMNYNLGVEIKLFNNRFSLTTDWYIETTKDLVSSINIPLANGFSSYIENVGEMENRGFELKASVFLIRDTERDLSWTFTGSMVHNKNKIVSVSQALLDAQKELEENDGANPNLLYKPGYSTNTIWVVKSLGIDPSTGREIYEDRFGKPTLTWDARDLQAAGLSEPKYFGNFSTMVRYKGLSMNLSFAYRFGGQLYNSTLINKVENADYGYNVDARVYNDRWEKPGDVVGFKGLNITEATSKSSRFVEDEKTLRCQSLNLAYSLEKSELKGFMGLDNLTFNFSTSDLFYWSTVKQERGTSYPFSRQFSFSVSATF